MTKSSFIEKGNQAPADYFVGSVNVNLLLENNEYNTIMGIVSFGKGARTNWHTHTNGQILLVIEGIGYYQEKGKPVEIIRQGDVIKIPANIEHWHGGSKESAMRHVAIVPDSASDKTDWLLPVTDEEYSSVNP
nr:cupin domain-containing protein [Pedobacter sp. ASV19]